MLLKDVFFEIFSAVFSGSIMRKRNEKKLLVVELCSDGSCGRCLWCIYTGLLKRYISLVSLCEKLAKGIEDLVDRNETLKESFYHVSRN